jgi:hypothetical protein
LPVWHWHSTECSPLSPEHFHWMNQCWSLFSSSFRIAILLFLFHINSLGVGRNVIIEHSRMQFFSRVIFICIILLSNANNKNNNHFSYFWMHSNLKLPDIWLNPLNCQNNEQEK